MYRLPERNMVYHSLLLEPSTSNTCDLPMPLRDLMHPSNPAAKPPSPSVSASCSITILHMLLQQRVYTVASLGQSGVLAGRSPVLGFIPAVWRSAEVNAPHGETLPVSTNQGGRMVTLIPWDHEIRMGCAVFQSSCGEVSDSHGKNQVEIRGVSSE
jgi:hypothetical protein